MVKFLQLNLHTSRVSQDLIMQMAFEKEADFLILSELNRIPNQQGWYGSEDGRCAIYMVNDMDILCHGKGYGFVWVETKWFKIYSCYFSPSTTNVEYLDLLARLEQDIGQRSRKLIVAGDFNAHSPSWGSPNSCHRGEILLDITENMQLVPVNQGSSPTFVRGKTETHIDITFMTPDIIKDIRTWKVLDDYVHSDHRCILFDLLLGDKHNKEGTQIENRWSWKKYDADKLRMFIESSEAPVIHNNAERGSKEITQYLKEACDSCMPRGTYRWKKKPCHWWTEEIATLRRVCLAARRSLHRIRHLSRIEESDEFVTYKTLKKTLKLAIKKSKEKSWKQLIAQVETDPWGLPYKLIAKKLIGKKSIEGLSTPGRLELIVDTLFPKHPEITWGTLEPTSVFQVVTTEELMSAAAKIPRGKAPGIDGIPDMIVKALSIKKPGILIELFNTCFKEGIFPNNWKQAKLILLRKGDKPLDQPSSYRPVCLLNTVSKLFERVIKSRLEAHLEEKNGLSDLQFGFRRSRSTVDAISCIMQEVNTSATEPLHRRNLCAIVSLDVANAFNTASWRRIDQALAEKKVPVYLRRVIRSYLSERSLTFGNNKIHTVTSGVPQGSVLGPLLWNIMYDDLLRQKLPVTLAGMSTAKLVAFADDVAVIATGRTTDWLEIATNNALEIVEKWMEDSGLQLSAAKTEAVMLTSKRAYARPKFYLKGIELEIKSETKYLGMTLSEKLGYKKHLVNISNKATATVAALSRLLPNTNGPTQKKRQILMSVVMNQLLYAAPIWSTALEMQNKLSIMEKPQRRMALRIVCAYRTVSTQAVLVVASVPPIDLLAWERKQIYINRRNIDLKEVKKTARKELLKKWQDKWDVGTTGRWTWRLIRNIEAWVTRPFGRVNFHITQMLTGHGCFPSYLHRFRRLENEVCLDCNWQIDDVEHTIFRCDRWCRLRRILEYKLGGDLEPENIVDHMLKSKKNWDAVNDYVREILSTKEEEERQRQR